MKILEKNTSLNIKINGRISSVPCGITLEKLLIENNINSSEKGVAICVNRHVISKSAWNEKLLYDQDEIEIVRATPGG